MLINRRSILSLLGLSTAAVVVASADAAKAVIEPLQSREIVPNGDINEYEYEWTNHTHTISISDSANDLPTHQHSIIAELSDPTCATALFPVGTRLMFEGTIAPDGWTIVS